jgi:hypothetical protein
MNIQNIELVLRNIKGSPLTSAETDANFTRLRDAIMQVASEFGVKIVVGAEPVAGERLNTVWIPSDMTSASVWDATGNQWVKFAQYLGRDVVFGAEPALGIRDKVVWIPTSLNGVYVWNGSTWDIILNAALYSTASGISNAYSSTLPGTWTLPNLIGRFFSLKIAAANTGPSTLNINGLGDIPIIKRGGDQLLGGDLAAAMVALFVYDGSNIHLLNPRVAITGKFRSENFIVPAPGGKVETTHGLGTAPDTLNVMFVCTTSDAATGYVVGDQFLFNTAWESPGSGDEEVWLGAGFNDTKVWLHRPSGMTNLYIPHKDTRALTQIAVEANFRVRFVALY